jgi:hypothetical protein
VRRCKELTPIFRALGRPWSGVTFFGLGPGLLFGRASVGRASGPASGPPGLGPGLLLKQL